MDLAAIRGQYRQSLGFFIKRPFVDRSFYPAKAIVVHANAFFVNAALFVPADNMNGQAIEKLVGKDHA